MFAYSQPQLNALVRRCHQWVLRLGEWSLSPCADPLHLERLFLWIPIQQLKIRPDTFSHHTMYAEMPVCQLQEHRRSLLPMPVDGAAPALPWTAGALCYTSLPGSRLFLLWSFTSSLRQSFAPPTAFQRERRINSVTYILKKTIYVESRIKLQVEK